MTTKKRLADKPKQTIKQIDKGGFGKIFSNPEYPNVVFKIVDHRHANIDKTNWFQSKIDTTNKKNFLKYKYIDPSKYPKYGLDNLNLDGKKVFRCNKMKYTLRQILRKRQLTISEIAKIGIHILNILKFFEANKMVFTDLKDSNIMCDSSSKIVETMKIIDYVNGAYDCNKKMCNDVGIIHKTNSFIKMDNFRKLEYNFYYHRVLFGFFMFKLAFPEVPRYSFYQGKYVQLLKIVIQLKKKLQKESQLSLSKKKLIQFIITIFSEEGSWSIESMILDLKKLI